MSSQTKIIKDILSTYGTILENKSLVVELDLVPLEDTEYSNVKYDYDGTQNDSVNKPLLDDLQTAAKSVGLTVTITTAKTGHADNGKRHSKQTAVDIALINGIGSGGATNATNGNEKFREMGTKLKDALVSMGYTWNVESGNPKAVLWQTNTGGNHFNHLHVSNNSGQSSKDTSGPTKDDTKNDEPSTTSKSYNYSGVGIESDPMILDFGDIISDTLGLEKKLGENLKRIKNLIK